MFSLCLLHLLAKTSKTLKLENSLQLQPEQRRVQVMNTDADVKPHLLGVLSLTYCTNIILINHIVQNFKTG